MASIVKHLRKLSYESDGTDLKEIDIRSPINDSLELISKKFCYEGIDVKLDIQGEGLIVEGDPVRLESVFQNFLVNSLQAFHSLASEESNGTKRAIQIHSKKEDSSVVVTFEDNAGGISEEYCEKIFEPFYTTKEVGAGTGLGLAIVKQIVTEMHGTILVESDHCTWTKFTLTFPIVKNPGKKRVTTLGSQAAAISFVKTPTTAQPVLVIDDEADIATIVGSLLEETFDVTVATDPLIAANLLKQKEFVAIVSDLKMPGMSGSELVLKARVLHPKIKVILISGHVSSDVSDEILSLQPYLFVTKPFSKLSHLREKIVGYIGTDVTTKSA
jgi:CheY-like chemotaxis protein